MNEIIFGGDASRADPVAMSSNVPAVATVLSSVT